MTFFWDIYYLYSIQVLGYILSWFILLSQTMMNNWFELVRSDRLPPTMQQLKKDSLNQWLNNLGLIKIRVLLRKFIVQEIRH